MRKKLIQLLRELEKQSGYKNEFSEFDENFFCHYDIEEYLNFPNYKFVISSYNNKYAIKTKTGLITPVSSNSILAELKRMEADSLIMIAVQEAVKYATTKSNRGPDFDEGVPFTTESIVLTTKGKSTWRYFFHMAFENPFHALLSIVAVVISVIALFF